MLDEGVDGIVCRFFAGVAGHCGDLFVVDLEGCLERCLEGCASYYWEGERV